MREGHCVSHLCGRLVRMATTVRLHAFVTGRVQGVFYRKVEVDCGGGVGDAERCTGS